MTAFRVAVDGQGWTFSSNEQGTDYGLDGDVEIFDGDSATGLTFRVQVRGKNAKAKRPSRSVKIKHLNYWGALGVPVLLVHHVVESGATYVKWVHRHDRGPTTRKQKTVSIAFSESDRLENRIRDLPDEVLRFRGADRDFFPRPIPIVISGETEEMETDFFYEFRRFVSENTLNGLIRPTLKPPESPDVLRVELGSTRLRASLPLDAGSVNAYWNDESEHDHLETAVFEGICAIGVLLARLNSHEDAQKLLCEVPMAHIVPYQPEASHEIARVSMAKGDPSLLVPYALLALHADGPHSLSVADSYLAALMHMAGRLGEDELDYLNSALQHRIGHLLAHDSNSREAARFSNNAAVLMARANEHERASSFALTAIGIPSGGYENRADLRELLGNCAWNLRQYVAAERWYREVQALGASDENLLSQISDTLAYQGKFREALDLLDEVSEDLSELSPRVMAMHFTLSGIVHGLSVSSQERRPLDVADQEAIVQSDGESALRVLKTFDALDRVAWAMMEDDQCDSLELIVARAFLTAVPQFWLLPVILASHPGNDPVLADKFLAIAMESSPNFAEMLEAVSNDEDGPWHDEEHRQRMLKALKRHETELPRVPRMNLVGPNNEIIA